MENQSRLKKYGRYEEIDKEGQMVVRFDTKREYTKEELKEQREQFVKDAKAGKVICISDLMGTHKL
jgi:hypothetical protein